MKDNHSEKEASVYIFTGDNGRFPAGAFLDFRKALAWIEQYSLSGILTRMPLDIGVYDWTIARGLFQPKKDYQKEARFIQQFSSAYTGHWHFEGGRMVAGDDV